MDVLALNSGSSSLKFGLYRIDAARAEILAAGAAESIGDEGACFRVKNPAGETILTETAAVPDQGAAIIRINQFLADAGLPTPTAIGHRVVHGGPHIRQHRRIYPEVLTEIEGAVAFAPLHMPAALSVIRFAQEHYPAVPQVACFDTVFHAGLPDVARILPIPRVFEAAGLRRYGFHGLSCESILRQLPLVPARLIIVHLGNGASVTAVNDGRSIDTSMGLTPAGGVIMGTRCGDLDPGILVYLMREKKFDAGMIEELIDRQSGLSGLSGIGGDMRRLHDASPSNVDAALAVAMFCVSVGKQIAAMITVLDGIDAIIFTGGIGENDPIVRASICHRFSWFGITLDSARNKAGDNPISLPDSRCEVLVLPSREDEQIALHTAALVSHPFPDDPRSLSLDR